MFDLILTQTIFGLTTIIVGLFFGYRWINYLRVKKLGQNVLELAPETHLVKQGTPTLGAAIIIFPMLVTMTMYCIWFNDAINFQVIWILIFTVIGFSMIGFVDDWQKINKAQNEGLTPKQKLLLQIVVAAAVVFMLDRSGLISYAFYMPMINYTIEVGQLMYYGILIFLIVGYSNATNITDGVDGLLGTTALIIFGFFFIVTAFNPALIEINTFILAMIGGLLAFLYYNRYPAKVFMGDTGSLMIGATMVVIAVMTNLLLPFLIISLIYLFETGSVFLQVSWFKYTKKKYGEGRRIFPMTPIHHSFEKAGWSENKVVLYFSLFTLLLCIFTYMGIFI